MRDPYTIKYFQFSVREQLKDLTKQYDKSENDLKALQSVGQVKNKNIRKKLKFVYLHNFAYAITVMFDFSVINGQFFVFVCKSYYI